MLESEYKYTKGVAIAVQFISFIISIFSIPVIQSLLASKLSGLLLVGASYIIAFALMLWALPYILIKIFLR